MGVVVAGPCNMKMLHFLLILSMSGEYFCDKIIFPQMPSENLILQSSGPTPECEEYEPGNSWCDPRNYPDKTMAHFIRKNTSFNQLLSTRSAFFPEDEPIFSYENICPITLDYIKPKAVMNKNGKFMFIVNQKVDAEEYFQIIKVSLCSNVGEECGRGQIFSSSPTVCMQEYADHKLVALSETGKELVVDTFSFPSCCTCKFKDGFEL